MPKDLRQPLLSSTSGPHKPPLLVFVSDISLEEENLTSERTLEQEVEDNSPDEPFSHRPTTQLSRALKIGTAESHEAAENVHFVSDFIQGKIDRTLYIDLVSGLYHIYVTLERLLNQYAPKYFGSCHFPKALSRVETLKEDMDFWHGFNWNHTAQCLVPTPAVRDYINRLEQIAKIEPLLILSHAYTRYLGDLSGGKVMARIARRALNLNGYDGLAFYDFENISSAKLFKDRYRAAMDGLPLKEDEIERIVAEANVAFALNMRVFEELDVKAGIPGAQLRDVSEALVYYDKTVEAQRTGEGRSSSQSVSKCEEVEKCPFGFSGGPSPHEKSSPVQRDDDAGDYQFKATEHEGAKRCPWPFIFSHDPAMGMRDWQTWLVIGIFLFSCGVKL